MIEREFEMIATCIDGTRLIFFCVNDLDNLIIISNFRSERSAQQSLFIIPSSLYLSIYIYIYLYVDVVYEVHRSSKIHYSFSA